MKVGLKNRHKVEKEMEHDKEGKGASLLPIIVHLA